MHVAPTLRVRLLGGLDLRPASRIDPGATAVGPARPENVFRLNANIPPSVGEARVT